MKLSTLFLTKQNSFIFAVASPAVCSESVVCAESILALRQSQQHNPWVVGRRPDRVGRRDSPVSRRHRTLRQSGVRDKLPQALVRFSRRLHLQRASRQYALVLRRTRIAGGRNSFSLASVRVLYDRLVFVRVCEQENSEGVFSSLVLRILLNPNLLGVSDNFSCRWR